MSNPSEPRRNPHHEALLTLLSRHDIQGSRVDRAIDWELRSWSPKEMELLLAQVRPLEKIRGNKYPCGPRFNIKSAYPIPLYILCGAGIFCLLPIQLVVSIYYLLYLHQFRATWDEIPLATTNWMEFCGNNFTFIHAPLELVRRGLSEGKAVCVNRHGGLRLMDKGYSIMSHVWGETHGWQSTTGWGAVSLELRRAGMPLEHLRRCIDACDAEWIWLDTVAMPAVLEGMEAKEADDVERTRVDVINQLDKIYTAADAVVVIDSALLRLRSASMVDAAAVLSVGFWMHRLWPMVECRLGRKVVLKTHEGSVDLDTLIDYLMRTINNDSHRYFPLLHRLTPLRPTPEWSARFISYSDSESPPSLQKDGNGSGGGGGGAGSVLQDAYYAAEGRHTDVTVDNIRVLFPLLGLKWEYGWSVKDGVGCIAKQYPEEKTLLKRWCEYRSLPLPAE